MSKFQRINNWINENSEEGITVLYPGGFKPLSGGHISLISKYLEHPNVKNIIVIVGPKTRNGITQDVAVEIAEKLTEHLDNVTIEKSSWPSPILTAYKMIENLEPGKYALAASSKGDDYKRVKDFTEQHQPGGKYYEGLPEGVKIVEMPIDVEPALFIHGKYKGLPISASILRKDILNNDWESFTSGYPENSYKQVKYVWDLLQNMVTESTIEDYENILNEASVVSSKNRHMTHAEDLVILAGKDGLDWVLKTMWNLYEELKGNTEKSDMKLSVKIDGCIHPDTLIKTTEGYVKILDIINAYPNKIYNIFGVNEKNKQIEIQEAEFPRINNNNKKWTKLLLEKGELIVTEDHQIFVKNKGWVEAKDLQEGDDILEINDNYEG